MEAQELQIYLKDVYDLESQHYIFRKIDEVYQKALQELDERRDVICWYEKFANEGKDDGEILSLEHLCKHIEEDPAYNRGNYYLLPLRWRTKEFEDIIEEHRIKINSYKSSVINTLLNHMPQRRQDAICRSEVIAYVKRKYAEDLEKKDAWTIDRKDLLTEEYNSLILPVIHRTKALLEKMYSSDVIEEKYRNFVSASMLYQYIDTNRCTSLEGTGGAYALFDSELRKNTIINRFDIIIFERAKLSETMAYAMQTVEQSESMTRAVSRSLGKVSANTAFSSYNVQCAAHNEKLAEKYYY